MKNFKSILVLFSLLACFTIGVNAQIGNPTRLTGSGDSLVITTAVPTVKYTYLSSVPENCTVLTIQVNLLKTSGTGHGSTSIEGSVDGTNYYVITTSDSLVCTNVTTTQTRVWVISNPRNYTKLRTATRGWKAARITINAFYIARKPIINTNSIAFNSVIDHYNFSATIPQFNGIKSTAFIRRTQHNKFKIF